MADENKRPEGEEAPSEQQAEQKPEHQPEERSDTTGPEAEVGSQERSDAAGVGIEGGAADVKAASPMDPLPGSQDADSAAAAMAPETKIGEEHAGASQHGAHAGDHDDHGLSHTTSVPLLLGVFAALTILTVLTVGVTAIDLGSQGNFVVAMVIATIKAALVMALFMHMLWDSKFNVLVFVSSFLFVLLFLSMSLADRGEYQRSIDSWETAQTVK